MAASGGTGKSWGKMRYKQDMPPPGGYGKVPYLRNLPVRGPSGTALLAFGVASFAFGFRVIRKNMLVDEFERRETSMIEMAYYPLLEAERDRNKLKDFKLIMEAEALNIVGTGTDPDYQVGQHQWEVGRWRESFNQIGVKYPWSRSIAMWFEMFFRKDVPGP